MVEKLRYGGQAAVLYETVRRIKSKPQRRVNILKENDRVYATIPEIAEKLAHTFSQTSSNENYSEKFLRYKNVIEETKINFHSDNSESYNRPFTLEELQYSITRTKDTTPESDEVHYQMLKKMTMHAKQYLCKMYNKYWQQPYFPTQWKKAIIMLIHKQGKIIAVVAIAGQ